MVNCAPHRKRCKRWDVPYGAHLLTFSCLDRKPLLNRDRSREWFVEGLGRARERMGFHLWAWVIMPEHVHLVVRMGRDDRIGDLLTRVKTSCARKAINWVRRNAPDRLDLFRAGPRVGRPRYRFWLPGGGYERYLRTPRDVHEKIRYVHKNPVRRGLVESPGAWAWSSYRAYTEGVDEPLPIDRETIPTVLKYD